MIQVLDSDWGFVIVEPWGKATTEDVFTAASGAFKEPYIGRKLVGLLKEAGFADIELNVSPWIDRVGTLRGVLTNMASYIDTLNSMDKTVVDALMAELDEAMSVGNYLVVLPQFIVTARK